MANHRADRRERSDRSSGTTDGTSAGGRRKATPPRRKGPLGRISNLPTVVGGFALLSAAGGTLASHGIAPSSQISLSAGTADLTGTDATFVLDSRDPRQQAISRDSERQALADASKARLQRAAEEQSQQRNAALASLAQDAESRARQIKKNLWILPTVGFHLTAGFGQTSGLWSSFHTGLDFAAPTGTPIYAVANGTITDTGWAGAYGNRTVETLDDGTEIWYAHQSEIGVHSGQRVTQGDQIGRVGATGNVTGPHVHIEVRPGGGDPVDPYPAFVAHGVTP